MSVRIHQLSKQIGIENKELIALLQERGYTAVKSASSTIDNISADALREEFQANVETAEPTPTPTPVLPPAEPTPRPEEPAAIEEITPPVEVEAESTTPEAKASIKLPPGVFVKSADDVLREREEKAAAAAAAAEAARPAAPKPPEVPAHSAAARPSAPPPPPPLPTSRPGPTPMAPPKPVSRPETPPPPISKSPGTPPPMSPPPLRKAPPVIGGPPPTLSSPPPPRPPVARPTAEAPPAQTPPGQPATESPAAPAALEAAEAPVAPEEVKVIVIKPPIVVRDFAGMIGLKPFRLISELMEMNIFASMNQVIEENVATELAVRHGFLLDIKHRGEAAAKQPVQPKVKAPPVDESKFLEPRPPVVCILGHVDHGKTTLLDNIRKASVVKGEAGGITQHIGAYQVETPTRKITFLDTPGHAAFSKMRARGATVTDIAILVVAADDGFMPQTDEALKHAQAAGVPVIVAINKTDARGANVERVKKQMQDRQIASEDWGGETITVPVSALKGDGIDDLLEMIGLQSEVLELKANPTGSAQGIIVEAQIEIGRGPTATVIVQKGTLKTGDALVCGPHYCKVRAMFDEHGKTLKVATPSTPARVIGWSDAPSAGSVFEAVKNEKAAKIVAEENAEGLKKRPSPTEPAARPTLEDLFSAIENQKKKTYRVVVRCDVHGSLEAVVGALNEIPSDKVDVDVIAEDVGMISQSDVLMASSGGADIIGFNVKLEQGVKSLAKHHGVTIHTHEIIYQLIDTVKVSMADLLDPDIREIKLGAAEVRQIFTMAKGLVAGCLVTEGKIVRDSKVRLVRQGKPVGEGKVVALKRFKDDATEVRAGYECGINISGIDAYEEGDLIEAFELQKSRASL
jgi:translation initiation factor IF-2